MILSCDYSHNFQAGLLQDLRYSTARAAHTDTIRRRVRVRRIYMSVAASCQRHTAMTSARPTVTPPSGFSIQL